MPLGTVLGGIFLEIRGQSMEITDNTLRGEIQLYSLARQLIYTVYEVTVAAIHTVGLLCVVASSGMA